jgi:hypothetical protein
MRAGQKQSRSQKGSEQRAAGFVVVSQLQTGRDMTHSAQRCTVRQRASLRRCRGRVLGCARL